MSAAATRRRNRPRRADGRQTRQRVLRVAARTFATSGYQGTSLRQIATAASVDLATLKYHFGTKPELFSEVYRAGHSALFAVLLPLIRHLSEAQTVDGLALVLHEQLHEIGKYLDANEEWVRMTVFRLLELPSELTPVEDRLQDQMLTVMEQCLANLAARKLIRPIEPRALVIMLLTALPTWYLCAQVRPTWMGLSEEGATLQESFVAYFTDALQHLLLPTQATAA